MADTNDPASPDAQPPAPQDPQNPGHPPAGPGPGGFDSGFITGEVRHQQVSAKVPERVAIGVFSTGAIVIGGASEFMLDFLVRMSRPYMVASRVILPHAVMPQVLGALRHNIDRFTERFGAIPQLPKPDSDHRPTIQEVYDDLRLSDEVICGAYANGVMISHTPAEFCFDFITNFFPRSAVSSRIYMSAPQVPRLLEGMTQTYNEHVRRVNEMQRRRAQQPPQTPPAQPGTNE